MWLNYTLFGLKHPEACNNLYSLGTFLNNVTHRLNTMKRTPEHTQQITEHWHQSALKHPYSFILKILSEVYNTLYNFTL